MIKLNIIQPVNPAIHSPSVLVVLIIFWAISAPIGLMFYLLDNTKFGQKWKSGMGLIYRISIILIIVSVISIFVSVMITQVAGLFYHHSTDWILYTLIFLVFAIIAPIFAHDSCDDIYRDWKNSSKSTRQKSG